MSLINDALRRASHASRTAPSMAPPGPAMPIPPPAPSVPTAAAAFPPPPPPPPPPPLPLAEPVDSLSPALEPEPAPKDKSTRVQLILALLLVLAVGMAAAMNFWEKSNRTAKVDLSANRGSKAILPEADGRARIASNTLAAAATTKAVTNAAASRLAATAVTAAAPVVAAPPQPPVKFPPLRLQSIFYRPSSPSVMINNKTLYVDDQIQGVTVADIQPSSVILVLSGQTNVLTLR